MVLQWNDWHTHLPKIVDTHPNWEAIFMDHYVNAQLTSPVALNDKLAECESRLKETTELKQHLQQICHKDTELTFNSILKIYTDSFPNPGLINPFTLSIPSSRFVWVPFARSKVPESFTLTWDRELFTDFHIKLSPESNFFFDIKPNLPFRLLRYCGYILYVFEFVENGHASTVVDLEFVVKPRTEGHDPKGDIDISYGQRTYTYNTNKVLSSIERARKSLEEVQGKETQMAADLAKCQGEITEYKQAFSNKMQV